MLRQPPRRHLHFNAACSLVGGIICFVTLDHLHPAGLISTAVWRVALPAAAKLLAVRFRRLTAA